MQRTKINPKGKRRSKSRKNLESGFKEPLELLNDILKTNIASVPSKTSIQEEREQTKILDRYYQEEFAGVKGVHQRRQHKAQKRIRGQLLKASSSLLNESLSDPELPDINAKQSLERPRSQLSSTKGVKFASDAGSSLEDRALDPLRSPNNQDGSPVVTHSLRRKRGVHFGGMLDGEAPGLHVSESAPTLSTVKEIPDQFHVEDSYDSVPSLTEDSVKEATSMDDFHFIGHLLHRVTEVSGSIPENAPAPWDVEEDLNLAANEVQIRSLSRSPEMLEVLSGLQQLSKHFREIRTSVASHRKHLAHTLAELQTAYIQLFEQMLTIVLRMQRKKDKAMREQLQFLTKENAKLKGVNEENGIGLTDLKKRYEAMEGLMHAAQLKAEVAEKQLLEMRVMEEAYNGLCDQIRQMELLREMDRKDLEATLKKEEAKFIARLKHEQDLLELRRQRMEERERFITTKLKEMESQQQKLNTMETQWRPIPETVDCETQTHVTDDGLWDKQDGWVIKVSNSMLARIMWRRARQFAGCPSCKGVGTQLKLLQKQIREDQRVKPDNETVQDLVASHKKTKSSKNVILKDWQVPDELVDFLCNLPKTIQAKSVRPLKWLVREIWQIYDEKIIADDIDDNEGQQVQDMNDFLMELFLKREGFREQAEAKLYELIIAIKEHYRKNCMVKTLARFMNLLEETPKQRALRLKEKKKKHQNEMNLKPTNRPLDHVYLSAYLFTRRLLLHRDKGFVSKAHSRRNSHLSSHASSPNQCQSKNNINRPSLPWYGSSPKKQQQKRLSSELNPVLEENSKGTGSTTPRRLAISTLSPAVQNLGEDALTAEFMEDLPLTVVMQKSEFWLRVDIVINTLRKVLNFLTLEQLGACCREIEYNAAFLTANGKVQHMEGMRTVVRSAVRKEMLKGTSSDEGKINDILGTTGVLEEGKQSSPPEEKEEEVASQYTVLFNMDKVLELVMEVLAMQETKISDKLAQLFVEGDDNGDGVLSFPEFQAIVKTAAPDFSERRILRMFREALTSGPESSFAISKRTFTEVCKKHGLVKLIDIHKLEQMERQERHVPAESRMSTSNESNSSFSRKSSMQSILSTGTIRNSIKQSKRKTLSFSVANGVQDPDNEKKGLKSIASFPAIKMDDNSLKDYAGHSQPLGHRIDSELDAWPSSTARQSSL